MACKIGDMYKLLLLILLKFGQTCSIASCSYSVLPDKCTGIRLKKTVRLKMNSYFKKPTCNAENGRNVELPCQFKNHEVSGLHSERNNLPVAPLKLLFWALHNMLCLRISQGIPEDENHSVVLKMITAFFVFQQPLRYIIHFPIQGFIYANLSLVSKFTSNNFLVFLPQLSYVALHLTSNQLSICQKATATLCVRSTILFMHLSVLSL